MTQDTIVPSTLEELRSQIAGITREDPAAIRDDDNLADIGLDSIRAMSLVAGWNRAGMPVDWSRFAERPRLIDWWELIAATGS